MYTTYDFDTDFITVSNDLPDDINGFLIIDESMHDRCSPMLIEFAQKELKRLFSNPYVIHSPDIEGGNMYVTMDFSSINSVEIERLGHEFDRFNHNITEEKEYVLIKQIQIMDDTFFIMLFELSKSQYLRLTLDSRLVIEQRKLVIDDILKAIK